jgi:hypothetical protein
VAILIVCVVGILGGLAFFLDHLTATKRPLNSQSTTVSRPLPAEDHEFIEGSRQKQKKLMDDLKQKIADQSR